jgi:hypothetical protein
VAASREILAEANSREELADALEAVDGHLLAKGQSGDGWLDTELAAKVPEYAEAIQAEKDAARTETIVKANSQRLQRAIAEGQPLAVPLTE